MLAISVITNMAAGVLDQPVTGEEVDETGKLVSGRFSKYLERVIGEM